MQITVRPTEQFFMAGDIMVRRWEGTVLREDGQTDAVVALITAVVFTTEGHAMPDSLVSIPPPTEEDALRWADEIIRGPRTE